MNNGKKLGRSTSSKSVLFLSDMHVGSSYAVCSPEANTGINGIEMNKYNKEMYENWCDMRDALEQRPDILCLNGEPIDGANTRSGGGGLWSTNPLDQLNDAERLIREYSFSEMVMTRGSRYHVTVNNMPHEEILAERMGCVPYSGLFGDALNKTADKKLDRTSKYTDFYLWYTLGGKRFSVCHHVGYNRTELYRTTALAREMAVMKFAEGKWFPSGGNVDFIVRSHVHYYVQIRFHNQIGFTTPAWKLPDEYLLRGGLGGTAINIGTIEVIIEPNGKIVVEPHIVEPKNYPKPEEIDFDKILMKKYGK